MSRRPATVLQVDIARTIRAAKQAGASAVTVRLGKDTTVVVHLDKSTAPAETVQQDGEIVL